jgi:hypothetical protein
LEASHTATEWYFKRGFLGGERMRTGYSVEGNLFTFIHAPESLVRKLEEEGFSVLQSFKLLSGDYQVTVRLPKYDRKNILKKLIKFTESENGD